MGGKTGKGGGEEQGVVVGYGPESNSANLGLFPAQDIVFVGTLVWRRVRINHLVRASRPHHNWPVGFVKRIGTDDLRDEPIETSFGVIDGIALIL